MHVSSVSHPQFLSYSVLNFHVCSLPALALPPAKHEYGGWGFSAHDDWGVRVVHCSRCYVACPGVKMVLVVQLRSVVVQQLVGLCLQ
jgi:hypothetical protein